MVDESFVPVNRATQTNILKIAGFQRSYCPSIPIYWVVMEQGHYVSLFALWEENRNTMESKFFLKRHSHWYAPVLSWIISEIGVKEHGTIENITDVPPIWNWQPFYCDNLDANARKFVCFGFELYQDLANQFLVTLKVHEIKLKVSDLIDLIEFLKF